MRSPLLKAFLWMLVSAGGLIFAVGAFYVWARLSTSNRNSAMENGLKSIDVARDFKMLFPESEEFISYYQGSLGYGHAKPRWTSRVGLYGRYIFTAQFEIELDWTRRFPKRVGEPEFLFQEISEIKRLPDGRIQTSYSEGDPFGFGPNKWERLKEADGDFGAIGYPMYRDRPFEDFEKSWR